MKKIMCTILRGTYYPIIHLPGGGGGGGGGGIILRGNIVPRMLCLEGLLVLVLGVWWGYQVLCPARQFFRETRIATSLITNGQKSFCNSLWLVLSQSSLMACNADIMSHF